MWRIVLVLGVVFGSVTLAAAGNIDGKVAIRIDKPFSPKHPAAVWLEGVTAIESSRTEPVMAQHGGQFDPPFLVVVIGQTVNMPNEDNVAHNVYSLSPAKQFDLGFYAKGQHKTVIFDRLGLVEVGCVIHSFMRGEILVVPNKYYAIVASDGSFHIRNVPAGAFRLKFWADGESPVTQEVTVPAGNQSVAIHLAPHSAP